ncbi:hypothetical protein ACFH04_14055 [Streptomyces noboritoensis]|uniref:Collagen-like protein n=2 Tax=Streptomyces TaxID=1883 RepID=A0ABV6TGA7_9ACTN
MNARRVARTAVAVAAVVGAGVLSAPAAFAGGGGGDECRNVEESVVCVGPQGPAGPHGPAGPAGPAGAQGPTGPAGPAGEQGPTGPEGPAGPQGHIGPAGPHGPTGPAGKDGAVGPKGDKGDKGDPGQVGPAGPKGDKGDKGDHGEQGAVGPTGPAGVAMAPKIVHSVQTTVAPGKTEFAIARCPTGTMPTGGGFFYRTEPSGLAAVTSHTVGSDWIVAMTNTSTADRVFQAQVVCLPIA